MSTPNSARKSGLMGIGIAVLIVGIVLAILGLALFFSSWGSSDPGRGLLGMGLMAPGFILIMVGWMLVYYANIGKFASYIARETSPAMMTASTAFGQGLRNAGGIPPGMLANPAPQVVKIRCRYCGYLETEDAKFCSNCGNPP